MSGSQGTNCLPNHSRTGGMYNLQQKTLIKTSLYVVLLGHWEVSHEPLWSFSVRLGTLTKWNLLMWL